MTKRTHIDKKGKIERLHDDMRKEKFAGNYQGPLYAPHPDLKK